MYVIQLPEWKNIRIAGDGMDWQIQKLRHRKNGDDTWEGTNFYPRVEFAIGEMYERMLRGKAKQVDGMDEFLADCKEVKASLLEAVRKAVV